MNDAYMGLLLSSAEGLFLVTLSVFDVKVIVKRKLFLKEFTERP